MQLVEVTQYDPLTLNKLSQFYWST